MGSEEPKAGYTSGRSYRHRGESAASCYRAWYTHCSRASRYPTYNRSVNKVAYILYPRILRTRAQLSELLLPGEWLYRSAITVSVTAGVHHSAV